MKEQIGIAITELSAIESYEDEEITKESESDAENTGEELVELNVDSFMALRDAISLEKLNLQRPFRRF